MARADSYPTGWFIGHLAHRPSRDQCREDEMIRERRSERAARARAAVSRRALSSV